jgi:hypothetical protein
MSATLRKFADVAAPISPAKSSEFHKTAVDDAEELVVSQVVDADDLRRLLECLGHEDCVHSWKGFGPNATLDALLQRENELRPTKLFFFYLRHGNEMRMVAASAVADRVTREFPHAGFCVLGRCYIMPQFRGRGFYRRILYYRLEYCREQFGNALNAIHIGSVNERISRVITNHKLAGWPKFVHLGEEELKVADTISTVGAYILLMPQYVSKMRSALVGAHAPARVIELRNALSRIESSDIRNLGMLLKETFEETDAHRWLDERDCREIEHLLSFCSSIPLIGVGGDYQWRTTRR